MIVFCFCFVVVVVVFAAKYIGAINKKFEPSISVIVPVYKVEKYLDGCLYSLENQTLDNIEIICINDGSPDNCSKILQKHAAKDNRIKVINQENQGVSIARNNGMKCASGKYIMFVDADDYLTPYACEKAYDDAVKYNVDMVGLSRTCFTDGEELRLSDYHYNSSNLIYNELSEGDNPFEKLGVEVYCVWGKLWKKSFLDEHNVVFAEGVAIGEDNLFNAFAFPFIHSAVQDNNVFYCYRVDREGSATLDSERNVKRRLDSLILASELLLDKIDIFTFKGGSDWVLSRVMDWNYNNIVNCLSNKKDKQYYSDKLVKLINNNVQEHNLKIPDHISQKINTLKSLI